MRSVVRQGDRVEVEHQVRQDGADDPPATCAATSYRRVAGGHEPERALDERHDRVERRRDRLEREDQRHQGGAGDQRCSPGAGARRRRARAGPRRCRSRSPPSPGTRCRPARRPRGVPASRGRRSAEQGPEVGQGGGVRRGSRPRPRASRGRGGRTSCSTLRWWLIVGWDRSKASLRSHTQASPSAWEATSESSRSRTGSASALTQRGDPLRLLGAERLLGQRRAAGDGLDRRQLEQRLRHAINIDRCRCLVPTSTHRQSSISDTGGSPCPVSSSPSTSTTSTPRSPSTRKLFGTAPAKTRPGYANFAVAEPPLKLILIENPGAGGSVNHLGVEVDDTDTVDAEQTRLAAAGPRLDRRARHHLLLREAGQVLGRGRPERRALGDLHGPRGQRDPSASATELRGAAPAAAERLSSGRRDSRTRKPLALASRSVG